RHARIGVVAQVARVRLDGRPELGLDVGAVEVVVDRALGGNALHVGLRACQRARALGGLVLRRGRDRASCRRGGCRLRCVARIGGRRAWGGGRGGERRRRGGAGGGCPL